jgi:hypothetical protein
LNEDLETPQQRRERYINLAENAERDAERAHFPEDRDQYARIAVSWRRLADFVSALWS